MKAILFFPAWLRPGFCLLGVLALSNCVRAASAVLPQRAYVWQRAWSASFQRSIANDAGEFAALDVLVVEIAWRNSGPDVQRIAVAWSALQESRRPVGLVVRIGPNSGSWATEAEATRTVIDVCQGALSEARRRGIEPVELQLDFDAATARLDAYRALLQAVRREVRPPKLVITALPDWLRSPAFAALIAETDSYVLQVHSLEKPGTIDEAYMLCDPTKAMGWIERVARLDHPFRVALPSYGYRLIFDATGKFAALEAEGPAKTWPAGFQRRLAIAEPADIAHCVQLLLASLPRGCEGLVWFRFPTADDELAWSWPTLRSVMQGRAPQAQLVLQSTPLPGGACDLTLANTGEAGAEPAAFRVTWQGARLLAADALAGWQLERQGPNALIVKPPPHGSNGLLRPGDTLRVGWLRLDRPAELQTARLP